METDEPSDDEILAKSRADPGALGELYERHASAVYRYLARRVGPDAAHDLLGDVFVAALEARRRFRSHESGSALPWLYGIAGNLVKAHLRARRPDALVDLGSGVDWHAVDARLDAEGAREQLDRMLAGLTATEREVLLLHAWEQLEPSEIALVLRISAPAARTRLSRARQRARRVLGAPAIFPA